MTQNVYKYESLFININQLDALHFYNKFISSLYMFRAHVLIVWRANLYYTASGIITRIGNSMDSIQDWMECMELPIGVMIPETV